MERLQILFEVSLLIDLIKTKLEEMRGYLLNYKEKGKTIFISPYLS